MGGESFAWNAGDYRSNSSAQYQWALELTSKLGLEGGERVLDIGCGDGKVTALLAERLPRGSVLGIDNSRDMVAFARENFPPSRYPNMEFRVGDALDLRFEGEFDVVFSNAVLHWVRDHERVLRGIRKSLRKGGRVLLQMGGRGNAHGVALVLVRMLGQERWKTYFNNFTFPYGFYGPEEYNGWLAAAGFSAKRVELIQKDMVQTGPDGLAGWIRTTWMPYTSRVPEELREEFIREIVSGYMKDNPPDDEGGIHVAMVRLEVEAENP